MIDLESPLAQAYLYQRQLGRNPLTSVVCARHDVERGTARYPRGRGYKFGGSWQTLESMPHHVSRTDRAYYCDDWPAGFRMVGRADKVASIGHKGWFTSDDGDTGTIAGYVLRLPHGRFIPGIADSDSDGVTLYPLDSYDDETECARAADRFAEIAAEKERDYQRAWRAGRDVEACGERIVAARREIIQLCQDRREALRAFIPRSLTTLGAAERLCSLARERVQRLLAEIAKKREERDRLTSEFGDQPGFVE